jgi:DNA polymerase I-like protein with 3'-5' exonuclease and polymerase domains
LLVLNILIAKPPQETEEMKQLVKNIMECDYGFKLPLKTSIETGDTWGEMH